MTKVAIDTSNESFYAGDIPVYESYGSVYGVKVLKKVYIADVNEHRYVVQHGRILNDAWKGEVSSSSKKEPILTLLTVKELRSSYTHKWEPGVDVSKGDVLKDDLGNHYLVESTQMVWNLTTGTHADLSYWEKRHDVPRTLTQVTDASGRLFGEVLNIK